MVITAYIPTKEEYITWLDTEYFTQEDADKMIANANDTIESFSADIKRERNKLAAIKHILEKRK